MRAYRFTMMLVSAVVTASTLAAAKGAPPIGRFVNPKPVYDDDALASSPSVTDDGLTLYFNSDGLVGFGDSDLFRATRSTTDQLFGNVKNLGAAVNSRQEDGESHITPDGLTLYFHSNRPGGAGDDDLYMATRPNLDEEFSNVANVGAGVNTASVEAGVYTSRDQLRLYFHSSRPGSEGIRDLYQASRNDTTSPFDNAMSLGDTINSASRDNSPAISSDELTIFFTSRRPSVDDAFSTSIWVATRDTTDDPFGEAVHINDFSLGSDLSDPAFIWEPHISSDWPAPGSKIYYTHGLAGTNDWDIYEATWVVPEPSTGVLACLGILSLLTWRRRSK